MKTFYIKRAIFGGRRYKDIETVRAANPQQAALRFTTQTIRPRRGEYAVFAYGVNLFKFKVK